ncbi:ATP-binding protein [Thermococcus argininiproducens]|uniref:ATP-binding protein n=1 Tax=Thermococcus argininiproducens TaxID=2866384 RepID=A0A9E7M8S2_9EURY|nr:ATP-binding protein [Thermococcus argininiproducens]USG99521.1 ATP-binding protein [Thermococcus argininiproducens]
MLYLNFDDPEVREYDVRKLAERVRSEYPSGRVHLFIDEVQEWKNWDYNLRWLHDVKDFDIYASGSSSSLLSSEIPSRLRGRYISRTIFPLSFKEIVRGEGIDFQKLTFRERGKIQGLLREYINYGGFPEVWEVKSREKIIFILDTMFYRDILERFGFRDIGLFREVFYYILALYSSYFTYRSLNRVITSTGVKVDTKTLMNYVHAMESAFLIFEHPVFSASQSVKTRSPRKLYLIDTGIASLFFKGHDLGRKIENVVFIELMRRKHYRGNMLDLSYYPNPEVDFVLRRGNEITELIQVTYELTPNNYEREVGNLIKAAKKLSCSKLTVVTWNQEEKIKEKNIEVNVVPLWRFLLR